jgi:hypothetical protein
MSVKGEEMSKIHAVMSFTQLRELLSWIGDNPETIWVDQEITVKPYGEGFQVGAIVSRKIAVELGESEALKEFIGPFMPENVMCPNCNYVFRSSLLNDSVGCPQCHKDLPMEALSVERCHYDYHVQPYGRRYCEHCLMPTARWDKERVE